MANRIFLIGYMGCGKTTIGKMLARRLKARFEDTDAMVERVEGASVEDIFYYEGEEYFRSLEREVLESIEKVDELLVISTGGGLPVMGDNMKRLLDLGIVVYLERPAEQIIKRLTPYGLKRRPKLAKLLPDEILGYMRGEIKEREKIYLQAQFTIGCVSLSDKAIVEEIISNLGYGK